MTTPDLATPTPNLATPTANMPTSATKIKPIAVNFDGGKLTSDAGAILLQQVDQKLGLTERISRIIHDPRDPFFTKHQQRDLLAQRIFALALGYEDVNDHQNLRKDPALLASVKNTTDEEQPLGDAFCGCRFTRAAPIVWRMRVFA